MKAMKSYTDRDILQYRSVWMGVAILWIMLFHSGLHLGAAVTAVKAFGYGGVDIMFFASGIGCWYSLSKDGDAWRFFKRRCARILPTFYVFLPIWLLTKSLNTQFNVFSIIGNIFFVEYFANPDFSFNWYMSAIWLFYLLTPVLYAAVNAMKKPWQPALAIALLVLASTAFWWNSGWVILVTRLPIYFLGLCVGKYTSQSDPAHSAFGGKRAAAMLAALLIGAAALVFFRLRFKDHLSSCGLYWYPFLLIVPGLCLLLSLLGMALSKFRAGKAIVRFFTFVGKHSLELYLAHVTVFEGYEYFIKSRGLADNNLSWLAAIAVSVLFAAVLCYAAKGVTALINLKKRENV